MLRQILVSSVYLLSVLIILFIDLKKLEEFFYLFHKKVLLMVGILLIGKELFDIIGWLLRKEHLIEKIKKIILHFLAGAVLFVFLFGFNSFVIERFLEPKLIDLQIAYPLNGLEIAADSTDVKIVVRATKDMSVYIIVKTPQGTLWVQEKLCTNKFRDELSGIARLGEGNLGIGEHYKILAIATHHDLPIGKVKALPPDAKYSNEISVKRIK